jgi:hypothetical protein
MYHYEAWNEATDVVDDIAAEIPRDEYFVCENPRCLQRGKKVSRPVIPLWPAPAAVVERVDRAREEERKRFEQAQREREAESKRAAEFNVENMRKALADFEHMRFEPGRVFWAVPDPPQLISSSVRRDQSKW